MMIPHASLLVGAALALRAGTVLGGEAPLFLGGPVPAEYRWTGLYVGTSLGLASAPFGPAIPSPFPATLPALPVLSALPVAPPVPGFGGAAPRSLPQFSIQMGASRQLTPGSGVVVGIEADLTGLPPSSR